MARTEVTVFGAGVFGLSVAFACLRRGARVVVVEPHAPGAGASGGLLGALAPHTPDGWNAKKQFQFESLIAAGAFWRAVEEAGGRRTGYARVGRLQPVADERGLALAHARAEAAAQSWAGKAEWRVVPAAGRDWAPVSPTGWLIEDTLSARIDPAAACATLAAAVAALGGRIGPDAPQAGGAQVWATGHEGLAALSAELGRPVGSGVKGQALALALDMPDAPQLFADGLHIVPHANGTVAVGSTSERDWQDADTTDAALDGIHARACAACPALADAPVVARWAGVRPRARSRAPMLGRHPARDDVFIANGGFKIGVGLAPKVAEVMADLVLEGHDAIPPEFAVAASLR
ncbi:FAD-dependent oxidoreductase [Maritimibacter sp. 55A14]|uniref:NAD(P)/FAD-dependent oxidoreductase n=1 Tax=Maritimibacter sp. 55A14 TaxID=2174844 RepID=UPI000D61E6B6|nr:FAD-binding oxidoreductase [Maritimibacter sp. 55A14]PWE32400.1 FAD-dependent oxidoreductase [Maritimibacter sp. 55A14]